MSKIFISYRREDSGAACSHIYDRLKDRFGKENIFKDVDSIPYGVSFPDYIAQKMTECGVALILIGPVWETITRDGRRRLDDPADNVRVEVEKALERFLAHEMLVMPVMVQNASVPDAARLPESIRLLCKINGPLIHDDPYFDFDMERLIAQIERRLDTPEPTAPPKYVAPVPPAPVTPPPATEDPAAQRVRQATPLIEAAEATGDWIQVLDRCRVLKVNSASAMPAALWLSYGRACLEEGEAKEGRTALETALTLAPDDLETLQRLASACHTAGDDEAASGYLRQALGGPVKTDAERLAVLCDYLPVLDTLKNWTELLRRATEGGRLAPEESRWLRAQLRALQELNRRADALAVARTLTARADATAGDCLIRARLARESGDWSDALAALASAETLAPRLPAISQERSTLRAALAPARAQAVQRQQWAQALMLLDHELTLTPEDFDLLLSRADLLGRSGQAAEAVTLTRALVQRGADNATRALALARLCVAARLPNEGWSCLERGGWLTAQAMRTPQAGDTLAVADDLLRLPGATPDLWLAKARLELGVGQDSAHNERAWQALQTAERVGATPAVVARTRTELFPPPSVPPTLAQLGFTGANVAGVQCVLPPVCTVAAGPFWMGSDPRRDPQAYSDEQPAHQVTLAAYQIARFPVTVAEYACFVRAKGSIQRDRPEGNLDHPVVNVTWRDAVAYAAWLAEVTGMPWRLPTEAEWEKAARWDPQRDVSRLYPWGDQFDTSRCNTSESGKRTTTPVSAYVNAGGASPCGAVDMAGNVWEWTSSLKTPYPYNVSDGREDPNSTTNRVLRGGSWYSDAGFARAAYRLELGPDRFIGYFGFRLLLSPARAGS